MPVILTTKTRWTAGRPISMATTILAVILVAPASLVSPSHALASEVDQQKVQVKEPRIAPVFMGRYWGKTRRDFIFDAIVGLPEDTSMGGPARKEADESVCKDNPNKKIKIGWFEQPLDHFDNSSTAKWKQHYQVNDQFFLSKNNTGDPVVFLNIGGEGPIDNKWVCFENYTYMELAKKYNALVIQLEHRFFGKNKGLKDLSTDSLKYLTTEQALEDLYTFIDGYTKAQNWTSPPKWVAFGGSYPGVMAAQFRRLYPGATQGAIASSAPLTPKLDYWEYALRMEQVINDTSAECYTATKQAFKDLLDMTLTDAGRQELKGKLNLASPLSANIDDINTVKFRIFDAWQGIIQYTYDARQLETHRGQKWTVANLCSKVTDNSKSTIERLSDTFVLAHGTDKFDPSYKNLIAPWQNVEFDGPDPAGRGWLWLQCNEFGWLQSTSNNGVFGDVVPLSYLVKMCSDLFDQQLTASTIDQRVHEYLVRYGTAETYNATNVVLPNGDYDPWSLLRTNASNNETHMFSLLTHGAAHCSDMYPKYDGEPEGLEDTRAKIRAEVDYYLSLESTWKKGSFAPSTLISNLSILFSSLLFACFAWMNTN